MSDTPELSVDNQKQASNVAKRILDHSEPLTGVLQGLKAVKEGDYRPATDVFAELKQSVTGHNEPE